MRSSTTGWSDEGRQLPVGVNVAKLETTSRPPSSRRCSACNDVLRDDQGRADAHQAGGRPLLSGERPPTADVWRERTARAFGSQRVIRPSTSGREGLRSR